MARVRLSDDTPSKTLELKTTSVELNLAERQVNKVLPSGRGNKMSDPLIVLNRELFEHFFHDFNAMRKLLKQLGVKSKHALHYNQTKEFQSKMAKGITEADVPAFLRKQKVEAKVEQPAKRARRRSA